MLIGSTVNVSETLHGIGSYTTGYVCTPNVGNSWTNTTFQVPLGVTQIDCVVTNTVQTAPVIVKKTWVGGIAQDSTTVSLNQGGSPLMTGTSTVASTGVTQTQTVITLDVKQNTTVDVSEALAAGNKASYDATYSCVITGTQTPLTYTGFAVPAAGATCVVTNTAKTVTVNLNKKWVHGVLGDTTQLTITPAAGEGSTVTGSSKVTSADETDASGIDTISTAVTSGGTANLSEVLGAGNFAQYSSALTCDGGSLTGSTRSGARAASVSSLDTSRAAATTLYPCDKACSAKA